MHGVHVSTITFPPWTNSIFVLWLSRCRSSCRCLNSLVKCKLFLQDPTSELWYNLNETKQAMHNSKQETPTETLLYSCSDVRP